MRLDRCGGALGNVSLLFVPTKKLDKCAACFSFAMAASRVNLAFYHGECKAITGQRRDGQARLSPQPATGSLFCLQSHTDTPAHTDLYSRPTFFVTIAHLDYQYYHDECAQL